MMANEKIICGRFSPKIISIEKNNKKIRIRSNHPKNLEERLLVPISTYGQIIIYKDKHYKKRDFFSKVKCERLNFLTVLTFREKELLIDCIIDFDVKLIVFEEWFPIFENIRYQKKAILNFKSLKKNLAYIQKKGIKRIKLVNSITTAHQYKIERKLRFKTNMDKVFFFADSSGYQEVFKFKEVRSERVIIALDFNSMYASCLQEKFLEPKNLEHIVFNDQNLENITLQTGLYRVALINPKKGFFRRHHPFKYCNCLKSYRFNLEDNQELEMLLHENELNYYKNFFEKVIVKDAFISTKAITHPLFRIAEREYNERIKFKKEGNNFLSAMCKLNLLLIHSSTAKKRMKVSEHKSTHSLFLFVEEHYALFLGDLNNDLDKIIALNNSGYFKVKKCIKGYKLYSLDTSNAENIYSLTSKIIATSRLKMVKTIEELLLFPSLEICYTNIDSIHISIEKNLMNEFYEINKHLISNSLGGLKVQNTASKGYWFDQGRYWLKSENKVVAYKNTLFNKPYDKNEFSEFTSIQTIIKGKLFTYKNTKYFNLENSFSYKAKLIVNADNIVNFKRYSFKEIVSLNAAGDSYRKEIISSKRIKISSFHKLATE